MAKWIDWFQAHHRQVFAGALLFATLLNLLSGHPIRAFINLLTIVLLLLIELWVRRVS